MGKGNGAKQQPPVPIPETVPAAPQGSAPGVPDGYQVFTKPQVNALRKPTGEQVKNAVAVAGEIKASSMYEADFGKKAIPQGDIVQQLTTAAAWSAESARAQRWAGYAKNMEGLAWHRVLSSNDTFQEDYDTAVLHDASIVERYPSLAAFRGARSAAAKRAAETKREKKRAAKAAAKG